MKRYKDINIILTIVLIVIMLIIPGIIMDNHIESNNKEELINKIVLEINDDDITENFLIWIDKTFGDNTLIKLDEYLLNNQYSQNIWHEITNSSYYVLMDQYHNKYSKMDNVKIIDGNSSHTISFIGDVSLADNFYIMPKYDERDKGIYGILSKDIVDIMQKSDVMIANNEFTISNRGEKMPGKYYTFRAKPERLSIYSEMGVDLVTLANNHVYDFGKNAFFDTLMYLREYDIPYIGAGKDIAEAMKPFYYIINGYKFAFVNATRAEKIILTPEATIDDGGVFRCYNPHNLIELIKEIKQDSDYVVTLIHWGKEDSHQLEEIQKETSKLYIDAGSDIIIGTHAHVLQGIEFYHNKPIIYNLGDFIFNNETKDTGIFQIKLTNDGKMSYYFIPALEKDEYTALHEGKEKERVINDINNWSINTIINKDGEIIEKAQ